MYVCCSVWYLCIFILRFCVFLSKFAFISKCVCWVLLCLYFTNTNQVICLHNGNVPNEGKNYSISSFFIFVHVFFLSFSIFIWIWLTLNIFNWTVGDWNVCLYVFVYIRMCVCVFVRVNHTHIFFPSSVRVCILTFSEWMRKICRFFACKSLSISLQQKKIRFAEFEYCTCLSSTDWHCFCFWCSQTNSGTTKLHSLFCIKNLPNYKMELFHFQSTVWSSSCVYLL